MNLIIQVHVFKYCFNFSKDKEKKYHIEIQKKIANIHNCVSVNVFQSQAINENVYNIFSCIQIKKNKMNNKI